MSRSLKIRYWLDEYQEEEKNMQKGKVKIADIPEGQLFKWNRVVYKKSAKSTDEIRAIDTRTGKEVVFYDGCKGLLIAGKQEMER